MNTTKNPSISVPTVIILNADETDTPTYGNQQFFMFITHLKNSLDTGEASVIQNGI